MLSLKDIAKLFEEIELKLIASLKRNLGRHRSEEQKEGFEWTQWQAEKLRNFDKFRLENEAVMKEYASLIDTETRELMHEQFSEGEKLVNNKLEAEPDRQVVDDSNFFGVNEKRMNALMSDITELEKRTETAALRMTDDIYRTVLNRVQLEMAAGTTTLNNAIDDAVKEFLEKGINCIIYKDGRRVNIADYVRMALRTTATRANLQGQAKRFAELGYDTVMTSQYSMCSDTCLPYQGKVYIDDVFTEWHGERSGDFGKSNYCGKWFMLLSVAIDNGLFHPNCRHTLLQYIDGITELPEPIDSKKDLERYRLEQKQRAMERNIRKLKRLQAGTMHPKTIKAYGRRLKEAQDELREFIESTNELKGERILVRNYNNEKSYGAGELTNEEKNDIISQEEIVKEAERRANEFSDNWARASLSETVKKLGLDKKTRINDSGKINYYRDDSNIMVVYDTNEDYFTVWDKTKPKGKATSYLGLDGNPLSNNIAREDGKMRGMTISERRMRTHFKNIDDEEYNK